MSEKLSEKELEQKAIQDAIAFYNKNKGNTPTENKNIQENNVINNSIPDQIKMPDMSQSYDPNRIESKMSSETDPDLLMSYEIVPLPSKGIFYKNGVKDIKIEYLTSKDEDLLTTPSFIDDGSVIDRLLERKIVDSNINTKDLLSGDKSALILFLRTSSYGNMYKVSVIDPRNGNPFEAEVDLLKLKYKEVKELPDSMGEFSVEIPMRKKNVKFRLLTSGEEEIVLKNSEARKEVYSEEFSQYSTMRLKAAITEINDNRNRVYIEKFVDVMPALDAYTIRRKILDVSPDVEMSYEFKTHDGYKFKAPLSMGIDFFFPSH